MCDYSLYSNKTRLAEEGEELILHKFRTGTLGFASAAELFRSEIAMRAKPEMFWATLKEFFIGRAMHQCTAICIPPGARLLLSDLPAKAQKTLHVGPFETVMFTEISDRGADSLI